MLNVIYGHNMCKHNNLYETDSSSNTMCYAGSSSGFRNKVLSEKGYVSNTTSTVYKCNSRDPPEEVSKDDTIVITPIPDCDGDKCKPTESSEFEYVIIADQDCPVDTSNSQCTVANDTIQDSYPYITLNVINSSPAEGGGEYNGGEYIKCDSTVEQDDPEHSADSNSSSVEKTAASFDRPCDGLDQEKSTSM